MDKLERIGELFAGLHFDREIMPGYVGWQAESGDLV